MIRSFLFILFGISATGLVSLIALILMLLDSSGKAVQVITKRWAWFILKVAGVRVEIQGLENISSGNSYAFISNHASLLDIPAIIYALPHQLKFLAKKELFDIPIFGQAISSAGHIRINREKLESAVASLKKSAVRLKKNRWSALVFAEGTRSPDGEVGKFKKGGIILAISMKIPIVPISISGSRNLAPKGKLMIRKGKIIITVGKPIDTEEADISQRNKYVELVRDEVVNNIINEDVH